jgi:hypothetical protein
MGRNMLPENIYANTIGYLQSFVSILLCLTDTADPISYKKLKLQVKPVYMIIRRCFFSKKNV